MSKNRPILTIKPQQAHKAPASMADQISDNHAYRSIAEKADSASKAVWDARLAELKAIRRSAGYED